MAIEKSPGEDDENDSYRNYKNKSSSDLLNPKKGHNGSHNFYPGLHDSEGGQ